MNFVGGKSILPPTPSSSLSPPLSIYLYFSHLLTHLILRITNNCISQTTGAWKLSAKEVKLQEKIASGAYGEVWRGALHNRWVVAIKKLFPSVASKSNSSKSTSSRKSSARSRKRAGSKAMKELFHDDEIKFLMRTIYNVQ